MNKKKEIPFQFSSRLPRALKYELSSLKRQQKEQEQAEHKTSGGGARGWSEKFQ